MSKDYTTVELRDCELKGIELAKEADKRCQNAFGKVLVFSTEVIPHKLIITLNQFKEFARLQEEPSSKPTGKELFKTSNGYVMEIKVEES
jgi:hypothetical protein